MIVQNKEIATVVVQERSDGRLYDFRIKFKKAYKEFNANNIVLDMSNISRITLKDVMEFREISEIHKKLTKKSFVIAVGANPAFKLPEAIVCAPTLQEALDLVEMEEIERDLGFL
ncbi:MAG: ribonuclease Z [Flavobacteriaceae bacterium]|nr:ribonuclease Z [Flavobacteriaceae bacterium]MDG2313908.1 ribonuclease Z [Flavobacteriaceae bacterium]